MWISHWVGSANQSRSRGVRGPAMNERSIFLEAVEIGDPAEQAAFLARACGGDAGLRRGVEGLLAANDHSDSFMRRPAGGDATAEHGPAEGPGSRVGPYKLLQDIGEG